MTDPVEAALEAVSDEASFLRFVQALGADFADDQREAARGGGTPYGPGPRGWENGSIEAFLDAAAAWAESSPGKFPIAQNSWRRCADILYAGKFYE
jgi:hypothetical protein